MPRFSHTLGQARGFERVAEHIVLGLGEIAQAIQQSDEPERGDKGGEGHAGVATLELAQGRQCHGEPGREIPRREPAPDARDPDGLPQLPKCLRNKAGELLEAFTRPRHVI